MIKHRTLVRRTFWLTFGGSWLHHSIARLKTSLTNSRKIFMKHQKLINTSSSDFELIVSLQGPGIYNQRFILRPTSSLAGRQQNE